MALPRSLNVAGIVVVVAVVVVLGVLLLPSPPLHGLQRDSEMAPSPMKTPLPTLPANHHRDAEPEILPSEATPPDDSPILEKNFVFWWMLWLAVGAAVLLTATVGLKVLDSRGATTGGH